MNWDAIVKTLSANNWSLGASVIAMLLATITILVALYQLKVGRAESRSSQAHSIYQQYLAMCIEYPELARGYEPQSAADPKYDRYKWFVSSLLFSFEQILEAKPNDKYWEVAIRSQLKTHRTHLRKSSSLKDGQWHPSLQRLLNEIIKET